MKKYSPPAPPQISKSGSYPLYELTRYEKESGTTNFTLTMTSTRAQNYIINGFRFIRVLSFKETKCPFHLAPGGQFITLATKNAWDDYILLVLRDLTGDSV